MCGQRVGKRCHMCNIFIEGIQGMGKSTLLQALAVKYPNLKVCREGDYSPVELAWCTWMTEEEYQGALARYPTMEAEIRANTFREGGRHIVTYTKILTDIPGFHKDLERYEVYCGRVSREMLEQTVLSRYRRFNGRGYLFECAFFQNVVEDLILFHRCSDEEILAFYHKLYQAVRKEDFLLLYLSSDMIEENIRAIRRERADDQGKELWYPMMLRYFAESPYGKAHGCGSFEDLAAHLRHRQQVEMRIIKEVLGNRAAILPSKQWQMEEVEKYIQAFGTVSGTCAN